MNWSIYVIWYGFLTITTLFFMFMFFWYVPREWNDPYARKYPDARIYLILIALFSVLGLILTITGYFL